MRIYRLRITAMILTAALALAGLSACAQGNSGSIEKGRYVEDTLGEGIAITGQSASYGSGKLRWIGEQEGKYAVYTQEQGKDKADMQSIPWLEELMKDGGSVSGISEAPNGTVYAVYTDKNDKANIAKSIGGQAATLIPMDDWTAMNVRSQMRSGPNDAPERPQANEVQGEERAQSSPGGGNVSVSIGGPRGGATFDPAKSLVPQGIAALDDGFLVSFLMQGVRQYDADGKEIRKYNDTMQEMGGMLGAENGLAVHGNAMAWPDAQKGEILLFNLADGTLSERIDYEGLDNATFVGLDAEGLFVADSTGISRWKDGNWNLIVDGSLTMLIMPNMSIRDLVCGSEGDWYAFLSEMEDSRLLRFRFDPALSAQPSNTLTVFSLYDNTTARLAIGEFQRKNSDVRVNLEVGIASPATGFVIGPGAGAAAEEIDNSATVEDVIRALNTQLLAGKGPDLIILDGLPLQSYIEKGVLKDISALAQRLTNEEKLLKNLTAAYSFDGKTYGLPSRFTLPVMLGNSASLQNLRSPSDLVAAVLAHGKQEPALLRAPDQLWEDSGLIMSAYDACVAEFTNGDGSLDEAALTQYLIDAVALTDAMRDIYPEANQRNGRAVAFAAARGGGPRRIDSGSMDIASGDALIHLQILDNAMGYAMAANQLGNKDGMGITSLFGKGYFTPVGGIGVAAASKQQDLAEQFIQTLVGPAVQDNFMADAFPVSRSAWETMTEQLEERFMQIEDSAAFNDMGFLALCEGLTTPLFVDQFVKKAVQAQAKGLVDGTVTPEEASAKIMADTRLYLAE